MRAVTKVCHLEGICATVCAINSIDHGRPVESEEGAEGSAYALETDRINKNTYLLKAA